MRRRTIAVLWTVSCVLLLGFLYRGLESVLGKQDEPAAGTADAFRLYIPAPDPNSPPRAFEAFPVFKTVQGHTVTLRISSERPGSVHVHGYEKYIDLVPHGEVTLEFAASTAGRFPVHLHSDNNAMEHLATVEVRPK